MVLYNCAPKTNLIISFLKEVRKPENCNDTLKCLIKAFNEYASLGASGRSM